jgi:hypothetical protein
MKVNKGTYFEHVDLISGSDTWKDFRKDKMGATDLSLSVTVNVKSAVKTKVSDNFGGNRFTLWGQYREPIIREYLNDYLDISTSSTVISHLNNEKIIASLDGIDDIKKYILEIKTTKYLLMGNNENQLIMLQDYIKKWAQQISHQYYILNDSEYKVLLAIECYQDNSDFATSFKPLELLVFECNINNGCFNVQLKHRFEIDETHDNNGYYPEVISTNLIEKPFNEINKNYSVMLKEVWNEICQEFLDLLSQRTNSSEQINEIDELLASYSNYTNMINEFQEKCDEIKLQLQKKFLSEHKKTYFSKVGSIEVKIRKTPVTEKKLVDLLNNQGVLLNSLNESYYERKLNIKKVLEDFKIEQPVTETFNIETF